MILGYLPVIIFLCAVRVRAERPCPEMTTHRWFDNLEVAIPAGKPIPDSVMEKIFSRKPMADDLLRRAGMRIPSRVRVEPTASFAISTYYVDGRLVLMVDSLNDPAWRNMYPNVEERVTGPAFIHEYAHGVFYESLSGEESPWPEVMNELRAAQGLTDQLDAYSEVQEYAASAHACERAWVQQAIGSLDPAAVQRRVAELEAAKAGVMAQLSAPDGRQRQPFTLKTKVIAPYTEFYSDLVAALVYDDPSIMRVSVNAYAEPDDEAKNRDFAEPEKHVGARPTEHERLAEARYALYALAWKGKGLSVSDKARILRLTFDVFSRDIAEKWRDGRIDEPREQQCSRIIEKLQRAFAQAP